MKKFVRKICVIAIAAATVAMLANVENICNASDAVYLVSLGGYLAWSGLMFRVWWRNGGKEIYDAA